MTMQAFAYAKTSALMDDVVFALHNAAKLPEADAVHKMRVAIRRFQQAIRLFRQYLEENGVEKVKAELRVIMQVAGELRNRDIAMSLVTESDGDVSLLAQQRAELKEQLAAVLRPYAKPGLSTRWRRKLGLNAA